MPPINNSACPVQCSAALSSSVSADSTTSHEQPAEHRKSACGRPPSSFPHSLLQGYGTRPAVEWPVLMAHRQMRKRCTLELLSIPELGRHGMKCLFAPWHRDGPFWFSTSVEPWPVPMVVLEPFPDQRTVTPEHHADAAEKQATDDDQAQCIEAHRTPPNHSTVYIIELTSPAAAHQQRLPTGRTLTFLRIIYAEAAGQNGYLPPHCGQPPFPTRITAAHPTTSAPRPDP